MATTKSTGETKAKAAPKKAAPKATAAKKAAPKKTKAAPSESSAKATAKRPASKKTAGPKLTPPQLSLLEAISKATAPQGYVAEKKPEQKTVDTLLKHKLIKKGKKDEKTKGYHVLISQFGKKYLGTIQAPPTKG